MKGEFTQKGKEAMERFKMESASEVGVSLKQGSNGDLTARQAGSIGVRHLSCSALAFSGFRCIKKHPRPVCRNGGAD